MWNRKKKKKRAPHSEETLQKMRDSHARNKEKKAGMGRFDDTRDIREQIAEQMGL